MINSNFQRQISKDTIKFWGFSFEYWNYISANPKERTLSIFSTILFFSCFFMLFSWKVSLLVLFSALITLKMVAEGINPSLQGYRKQLALSILQRDKYPEYRILIDQEIKKKDWFLPLLFAGSGLFVSFLIHSYLFQFLIEEGFFAAEIIDSFDLLKLAVVKGKINSSLIFNVKKILYDDKTKYVFIFYSSTLFIISVFFTSLCSLLSKFLNIRKLSMEMLVRYIDEVNYEK